jgi:hypothetical protein
VDAVAIVSVVVNQLHRDLVHTGPKMLTAQSDHAILEIAASLSLDGLAVNIQVCNIGSEEIEEEWLLAWIRHRREVERDGCLAEVGGALGQG